ncbi:hypothetical protein [Actinomadura miaoliensis]|uniref:Uncharacterized protein n=1 Tax=Actinomadura miaoliensis TaxID=430685 RepID=A0ABP7WMW4_9ACTN
MWPESIQHGAWSPGDRPRPARLPIAARFAVVVGLALAGWLAAALLAQAADATVTDTDEVTRTEAGGERTAVQRHGLRTVEESLRETPRPTTAADEPETGESDTGESEKDEPEASEPEAPAAGGIRRHPLRRVAEPAAEPLSRVMGFTRRAGHGDCPVCFLMGRRGPLGDRSFSRALDQVTMSASAAAGGPAAEARGLLREARLTLARVTMGVSHVGTGAFQGELRPVLDSGTGGIGADARMSLNALEPQPLLFGSPIAVMTPAEAAAPRPAVTGTVKKVPARPDRDAAPATGVRTGFETGWAGDAVRPAAVGHCRSCVAEGEPILPRHHSPFTHHVPADMTYMSASHPQLSVAGMLQAHMWRIHRDSGVTAVPYKALNDMIAAEDPGAVPD